MSLARAQHKAVDMAVLEPKAAKLARGIQGLLESRVGGGITLVAGAPNAARYPEWRIAQNPFCALLRFGFSNGTDKALVYLPGYLISQIVDLHYGGCGAVPPRAEFAAAELRFANWLGEQIAQLLEVAFGASASSQVRFIETHTDLLQAGWPKARDAIVVQPISAEGRAVKPAIIGLILAADTVRSLPDSDNKNAPSGTPAEMAWTEQLRDAAMRVQLPARTVLARSEVSFQQLMTMAPGDVLPLLLPAQIPLTVAGRCFAYGTLGEANGRAALMIEKMMKEMDQ